MSDTADNIDDVEDVLSSIRRLVSETAEATKPPMDATPDPVSQTAAAPQPALVLTSAQRVDQRAGQDLLEKDTSAEASAMLGDQTMADTAFDEAGQTADSEQTDVEGDGSEGNMPHDGEDKPMMLDSLRRAVSGAFEEEQRAFLTEPEGAVLVSNETKPRRGQDRADELTGVWPARPPEDYYEDEADKDPAAEIAQDAWSNDAQGDEAKDEAAEAPRDTDEAPDRFEPAADEDDVSEADVWFDPALEPGADVDAQDGRTAQIHHFDPQMTVVEAGWTEDGEIIDAADIVAVDAASEEEMELDSADAPDVEEDDTDSPPGIAAFLEGDPTQTVVEDGIPDAEIAEDMDLKDEPQERSSSEGSMFAEDYDAGGALDDGASHLAGAEDAALMDEEALREMVAEIVRQELTGDMGERITRNVRKLVRREIHRALMTREFD